MSFFGPRDLHFLFDKLKNLLTKLLFYMVLAKFSRTQMQLIPPKIWKQCRHEWEHATDEWTKAREQIQTSVD